MIALLPLFLAALLFTGSGSTTTSTGKEAKIPWSKDYQLQWKDFEAPAKNDDHYDAFISCRIDYNQSGNKVNVFCYFKKNESWHIEGKQSEDLLKHEQYHFHIAEVYARRFRKQIAETGVRDISKKFQAQIDESREAQKNYDEETNHSKNTKAQEKWERYINEELERLAAYDASVEQSASSQ
jgi:hypothetical protein